MKIDTNCTPIKKIHFICFTGGVALMIQSKEDTNFIQNGLDAALTKSSLKINARLTKALVASEIDQHQDRAIDRIKEFCCSGDVISKDNK